MKDQKPQVTPIARAKVKRRHHHNPRFILANFTTCARVLYMLDKKSGKIRQATPANLVCVKDFYNYTPAGGQPDCIEDVLADLEAKACPMLRRIWESRRIDSLSHDEWETIEWFVIVQWLRTPRCKSLFADFADAVRSLPSPPPLGSDLERLSHTTREQAASDIFEIIKQKPPLIAGILQRKSRRLLTAPSDGPTFYTSDNPIVLRNQHGGEARLILGGVGIFFPLTPLMALAFVDPEFGGFTQEGNTDFRKATGKEEVIAVTPSDVVALNELQVRACSRFVYSASNSFEIAISLLNAESGVSEPPQILAIRPAQSAGDHVNAGYVFKVAP